MTFTGEQIHSANKRLSWVFVGLLLWFAVIALLGGWWGSLILNQAEQLAALEGAQAGHLASTQRMLFWEFSTFFVMVLIGFVILFWIYWRDSRRTFAMQAFFASVTHELRTPLTSIRLQAESISESATPETRLLVQRLMEDTLRLESQVERTLELARVEGGGKLLTESMTLRSWSERVFQSWRETYGKRLKIENELPDLSVQADPSGLQLIFRNLLENAIRHSKADPTIVRFEGKKEGSTVIIEVSDNGSSFSGDPTLLGEIFYRGPGSQGAGVGLYLIRRLMRHMHGKASFITDPAKRFRVRLEFQGGSDV